MFITNESDTPPARDEDLQRKFEATDLFTNLVKAKALDHAALFTFIDRAQGYVATVAALIAYLGIRSTAVPGILFAGQSLPLRLGRALDIINKRGSSVHVSLQETFASIRDAHGDRAQIILALLGALEWKDASSVGRAAIILRTVVEHRRGFSLPRLAMDDIRQGAAE